MFEKNETVVYGRTGICTVDDIVKKSLSIKSRYEHLCYVLKPVYDTSSTIFVPVDNEALTSSMRYVMTKDEIDRLIESVKGKDDIWIENQRERTQEFRSILSKGIQTDLILMIKSLFAHKKELVSNGKKLCSSDEIILKDAKQEVSREFAYALGIDRDSVEPYIAERLNS